MRGHDWQAISDAYPLAEVASAAGVELRRQGQDWTGCCPFHQEKTASFRIYGKDQSYHCFGCGAHGDVVDFVAKMDRLEPAAAVAKLTGGNAPRMTDEDRQERVAWLKRQEEKRTREAAEATARAVQRWERAKPLDGPSPYLDRKQIPPHGCRVEGQNLLIPVHDSDGEIMSVQAIPPEVGGVKLYQRGAPVAGGRLNIGIYFGRVFICEGFATAASLYEAYADQICIAFSKDNIPVVARELVGVGAHVIIAADRKGLDQMQALGRDLGIPVVYPPQLKDGDDFNDQMVEQGIDAVRETIANGLIDFANAPPPPEEAPFCAISFVDAFDFDEAAIAKRKWLIPGAIMAGNTHILAAPGGTGKSLFTLQLAITLASGKAWGKWEPSRPCKVMIINAEDDVPEQHRRLAAARTVMGMDTKALRGRILMADSPTSISVAEMDAGKRIPRASALVEQLVAMIRHHSIDVLIVDPFTETFEGDENSNDEVKWAMKVWRDDIARATGAAVYLVHHVTKDSNDGSKAGSASAVRGASALVNSVRFAATMFGMNEGQAAALGVPPEERFKYVRYDDAKSNHSLISGTTWFEKVSVVIQNGERGDSDGGDEVGALRPWEPSPPLIMMHDKAEVMAFLDKVNDGYVTPDGECLEQPFIRQMKGPRWIGNLIQQHLEIDNKEAKALVDRLIDGRILSEYVYRDEMKGRDAKGLQVDLERAKKEFGTPPV